MREHDGIRIALVDAFSSGMHLARALHQLGVEVIHVRSAEHLDQYYEATFRSEFVSFDLGFAPFTQQLDQLRTLRVQRVLPGTESGVGLAERLAARLGVPTNVERLADARRDKHAMARALEAAGVPAPCSTTVTSAEEAAQWCRTTGIGTAVVKPLGSAGSDNVWICRDESALQRAVARVLDSTDLFGRRNEAALVQEYLTGPEFYINAVSSAGSHSPVEIWRYTKKEVPDGHRLFDHEDPIHPTDPEWEVLWNYSGRVLDALGFRNGPSHLEVILHGSRPLLIDPAARLGGGVLPAVNERLTGTSHALETALVATGLKDQAALAVYPDTTRYVSLVNSRGGTVTVDWIASFEQLPGAVAVHTSLTAGKPALVTKDLLSSPGFVYLHGPRDVVLTSQAAIRDLEARGCYTLASPPGG